MFFFFIGLLCGVFLAQEVPTVPKLRPYLDKAWQKINPGPGSSEEEGDSSSKND